MHKQTLVDTVITCFVSLVLLSILSQQVHLRSYLLPPTVIDIPGNIPLTSTTPYGAHSFYLAGPIIWNSSPLDVQDHSLATKQFRNKLKRCCSFERIKRHSEFVAAPTARAVKLKYRVHNNTSELNCACRFCNI